MNKIIKSIIFIVIACILIGCLANLIYSNYAEKKAARHLAMGDSLSKRGKLREAIIEYDRAVKLRPKYAAAYYRRAETYMKLRQLYDAIADYERYINLTPPGASEARYKIGRAHIESGKEMLMVGGLHYQAIEEFTMAIQADPGESEFHIIRSNAYYNKGYYKKAIEDLDKAIQLSPHNFRAFRERGIIYLKIGQYKKAGEDLTRAVKLNPRDFISYINRGIMLFEIGEVEEALRDLNMAINIDPEHGDSFLTRARIKKWMGSKKSALADFNMAVRLYGSNLKRVRDDTFSLFQRAKSYLEAGREKEALSDLNLYIERAPEDPEGHFLRGEILAGLGRKKEAVTEYEKAYELGFPMIENYQYDPWWYYRCGLMKSRLHQYKKAVKLLTHAVKRRPGFAEAYIERGFAYLALARTEKAGKDFKRALSIRPKGPIAKEAKEGLDRLKQ